MPIISTCNMKTAYERHGSPHDVAILMLMGLGAQLVMWPDALIDGLVATGRQVITMDNRDIGLSEKWHGARAPHPLLQSAGVRIIGYGGAPYDLDDMAADAAALIDALDLKKVHVIGTSMSGIIGQILAADHADKVLSLTTISSTTGASSLPNPDLDVVRQIARREPPPRTREEAIQRSLKSFDLIGTKDEDHAANGVKDKLERAYDRCYYPQGSKRQTAAIIETGDISKRTQTIDAPVLALHGSEDPLVPNAGGKDIAARARSGRYVELSGMGHDLPPRFVGAMLSEIRDHLDAAEQLQSNPPVRIS